jgi:hypothetical protein
LALNPIEGFETTPEGPRRPKGTGIDLLIDNNGRIVDFALLFEHLKDLVAVFYSELEQAGELPGSIEDRILEISTKD